MKVYVSHTNAIYECKQNQNTAGKCLIIYNTLLYTNINLIVHYRKSISNKRYTNMSIYVGKVFTGGGGGKLEGQPHSLRRIPSNTLVAVNSYTCL